MGKGTQASSLAADWGLAHLSTGDLLRAAVAEGSELGRAADGHMRAGHLVPDALVLGILRERFARPAAAAGFVLDGFPRNVAQAAALEQITSLDRVVSFELPEAEIVRRLAGRRVCPRCGSVYHLVSRPPREEGRCDRDATTLVQRPDDHPEAIAVRLRVYAEQTAPLLLHYDATRLLLRLDAAGTPDEVGQRLRRLLA